MLIARLSLSFLWVFSGLTSLFFAPEIGYDVLYRAGIEAGWAAGAVIGGSVLDMTLGLWLLSGRGLRFCYGLQSITIIIFTVLLTLIAPEYWLHPFGPVTKNAPILALIGLLFSSRKT